MPPRIHLPADVESSVDHHASRIFGVERRIGQGDDTINPKHVVASFPGSLYPGMVTTPFEHPEGGKLVSASIRLASVFEVEDEDDLETGRVLLAFRKNGNEVDAIHSAGANVNDAGEVVVGSFWTVKDLAVVLPGKRSATVFFRGLTFAPLVDDLTISVTETGLGCANMTIRTDWA